MTTYTVVKALSLFVGFISVCVWLGSLYAGKE